MATCFQCKSKDGLVLLDTGRLYAKSTGTYSIAGAQTKVAAGEVYELHHPVCGWKVAGTIEHGYLLPLSDWDPSQDLRGDE